MAEMEMVAARVNLLMAQCRKHQLFREKGPESEKMAEIGLLNLQLARTAADAADREVFLEKAATALARAKRLTRDRIRSGD